MTTRIEHEHKELQKEVEALRTKLSALERDQEFYRLTVERGVQELNKVTNDFNALKKTLKLLVGD